MKQMRDDQWQKLFDSVTNMSPSLIEKTSITAREEPAVILHPRRWAVIKWVLVAVAAITAICALFAISILNDMAWIRWGKWPETISPSATMSGAITESPVSTLPNEITDIPVSSDYPETKTPDESVAPLVSTTHAVTTVPAPEGPEDPSDYTHRLLFIKSDDENSYIVSGVTSIGVLDFNVVVPAEYKGLPVTEIGDYAFVSNQTLTTFLIPESVTRIGDFCFAYSLTLSTITFQGTVAQWDAIEKGMMWNSGSGIQSIICTDGTVISSPTPETTAPEGPEDPFDYSQRLLFTKSGDGNSYIVSGVTSIGVSDFNVIIPAEYDGLPVTEIGDYAFVSNQTLTTIEIPASITRIGDFCFADSLALSTITFQGTVAQWNAIEKGMMWNSGSGIKSIVCIDGTI